VPETSRGFHQWQPAPGWRLPRWLAHSGNPVMNPIQKGEEQTPVTMINQWKERKEQGRENSLVN